MPNTWTIKGRVTSKFPIREWSNEKGSGKLFNFDIKDQSGEIRVTAFRDLVDKFFDIVEIDEVYSISKSQVKISNKLYSNLEHNYEITLTDETVLTKCLEASSSEDYPSIEFNFKNISEILELSKHDNIDTICICQEVGEIEEFTAKSNGRDYKKRIIKLFDESGNIDMVLWNENAEKDYDDARIVLIRGGKVSTFNDEKYIAISGNTIISINPQLELERLEELNEFYDENYESNSE